VEVMHFLTVITRIADLTRPLLYSMVLNALIASNKHFLVWCHHSKVLCTALKMDFALRNVLMDNNSDQILHKHNFRFGFVTRNNNIFIFFVLQSTYAQQKIVIQLSEHISRIGLFITRVSTLFITIDQRRNLILVC